MSSKEYSISEENIKLVYFRSYSDFCYDVGGDFFVTVSQNNDGFTEIHGKISDITRKLLIFRQPAILVFNEISPTDFIYSAWGYLKENFLDEVWREFGEADELIRGLVSK